MKHSKGFRNRNRAVTIPESPGSPPAGGRMPPCVRGTPGPPMKLLSVKGRAGAHWGGRRLGIGQREVAGGNVSRAEAAQLRLFLGAPILRERAAGAKPAAGGWVDGARQLARDDRLGPGPGHIRLGHRDRGPEPSRVGMGGPGRRYRCRPGGGGARGVTPEVAAICCRDIPSPGGAAESL
jgi:hypothetical protein